MPILEGALSCPPDNFDGEYRIGVHIVNETVNDMSDPACPHHKPALCPTWTAPVGPIDPQISEPGYVNDAHYDTLSEALTACSNEGTNCEYITF